MAPPPDAPVLSPAGARGPAARPPAVRGGPRLGDRVFHLLCLTSALAVPFLAALLVVVLVAQSWLAISRLGPSFLVSREWDTNRGLFGAVPFVYGTLVTSALAMLIAVPLGVGAAAFLSEVAGGWARRLCTFLIELLAAIPSVVYGFWGVFFLVPLMQVVFR